MKGETIKLSVETRTGFDPYGAPVVTTAWEDVDDVLVAPFKTSDINVSERPSGDDRIIELHFPKTFDEDLRNRRVIVREVQYKIIGEPVHYTLENTPTRWWLEAHAEVVDG